MMHSVPMQTVSGQPVAVSQTVTISHMNVNDWNSGICDCCEDMGLCCFAYWCFPCFQCSTVNDHGECLCLPLLDTGCLGYPLTCPPVSMAMRASVRERYNIPGSIFNDCCTMCWCLACSWCQMAREIKKRKQPVSFINTQTTAVTVPTVVNNYPAYPPVTY